MIILLRKMYHDDKIYEKTKLGDLMSAAVKEMNSSMEFTPEKVALLKSTIAKGCSNDELELFMHTCKHLGLDPFVKQIYAVKRGNAMTIQTGIDGYRLIAERSGRYVPGREPTYRYDEKGRLVSATAYVKKMGSDGSWHEVACTAFMDEYDAGVNLWKKMPHVMLAKCAESAALRRAFPAEMSGIHTDEEMSQADIRVDKKTGEIVECKTVLHRVPEEDRFTLSQVCDLSALIGDDIEFRDRMFKSYEKMNLIVEDYMDMPAAHFETAKRRAELHNQKKQEDVSLVEKQ